MLTLEDLGSTVRVVQGRLDDIQSTVQEIRVTASRVEEKVNVIYRIGANISTQEFSKFARFFRDAAILILTFGAFSALGWLIVSRHLSWLELAGLLGLGLLWLVFALVFMLSLRVRTRRW